MSDSFDSNIIASPDVTVKGEVCDENLMIMMSFQMIIKMKLLFVQRVRVTFICLPPSAMIV